MLELFEVIWIFDRTTKPQKRKMVVCLDSDEGWFLRINSKDRFKPCVPISQSEHSWLEHDSYVECTFLMLDEFEVDESIRREGIVGQVSLALKTKVLGHLKAARYIRDDDKRRLIEILG